MKRCLLAILAIGLAETAIAQTPTTWFTTA
jgi:hypothetical protein